MKRILFILVLIIACITNINAGDQITISGVQYNVMENNTVMASLTVRAKGEVAILDKVKIGKNEYVVTHIGAPYYKTNKQIKSIVLPNSITTIGERAFSGCPKLQKIVFPVGFYTIGQDAFLGCDLLTEFQGNVLPYNEMKIIISQQAKGNISGVYVPKFYTYAKDKLKTKMEVWQKKKEYESLEQYKNRVTEEKRLVRMKEFEKELQEEYVSFYAPKSISTLIGTYDSEYEVYTIHTDFYGNIYVKVPKADANSFRQNYKEVVVRPMFGVRGDTLAVLSCNFLFNSKTYTNVESYENGEIIDRKFELPPLDIDEVIAEEKKKEKKRVFTGMT